MVWRNLLSFEPDIGVPESPLTGPD